MVGKQKCWLGKLWSIIDCFMAENAAFQGQNLGFSKSGSNCIQLNSFRPTMDPRFWLLNLMETDQWNRKKQVFHNWSFPAYGVSHPIFFSWTRVFKTLASQPPTLGAPSRTPGRKSGANGSPIPPVCPLTSGWLPTFTLPFKGSTPNMPQRPMFWVGLWGESCSGKMSGDTCDTCETCETCCKLYHQGSGLTPCFSIFFIPAIAKINLDPTLLPRSKAKSHSRPWGSQSGTTSFQTMRCFCRGTTRCWKMFGLRFWVVQNNHPKPQPLKL